MAYSHLRTAVQVGTETSWGSEVATATVIGTVKSFTPDNRWDVYEVRGCGEREVQNFLKVGFSSRPRLTFEVHEFSFLQHAVGPLAGAGTSASHYTITEADWTGVTANTDITPCSIECGTEAGATDDVDTYVGCFIDSFTLDANLNGVLTCTANLICKNPVSSATATSYTPPTTHPWSMNSEGTFKWGGTPTAVAGIRNASITFDNNMIVYGDWNTIFISMPEAGLRDITWSVTVVMSSSVATAMRDDFYGQANSPLDSEANAEFEADNELWIDFSQGSSSTHRNATIALDQCIIDYWSKPIDFGSNDVVLVTLSGRAKTSKSNKFAEWYTVT